MTGLPRSRFAYAHLFRRSAGRMALAFVLLAGTASIVLAQETAGDFLRGGEAAPEQALPSMPVEQGEVVQSIEVVGAQRLERDTVASYLALRQGDRATAAKIDQSIKSMYATGLFSDIRVEVKGGVLEVKVAENPIVNQVVFEGNDEITKDDLEKEVQLKPRLVYTLPRVQKDVQRILELYRRSGRFAAVVEPKIINREQNRVDVVFEITEGDRTGVRRIRFLGNDHYSESDLRDIVNTRESAWWRFLSSSDFYDPDRMAYDRELLRRFYLNEGYVDFRVVSSIAELTPDRKDFYLTFTMDEGPRYKFGKIEIASDIKGLDPESLRKHVLTREGDWYNADKAEKTVAVLTAALGDMQYAFVDITPDVKRNKDTLTVDLTYRVKPGQRVFIGRIDVTGNQRTLDRVIRREMSLAEGDPFSTSKLKKSEQQIKDLGFFEEVKVSPEDGATADRANLKVEVTEKSTGEISFGAGFSSTDGPLGNVSIRERNFLGKGQDVRIGATISGVSRQFDLSFTEPYFLGRNLSAGGDVFHTMRNNQDESSYDQRSTGFAARLGYPLSEDLRQLLNYTLHKDEISNVPTTASRFIKQQQGDTLTSLVGQELIYDVRDSKLDPTKGFMSRIRTEYAGLGGDHKFARLRVSGNQYFSLSEDFVLSVLGETGFIWGLNQDVRITDRFFLGGDTLRGFTSAGVGPRDMTDGAKDALGGNRFVRGSLELTMPLPVSKELGLKAHLFSDAGVLDDCDEKPLATEDFRNDAKLRASVGMGMTWQSPFGPLRLDIAVPVKKEGYDETELVHFSFGTRF